VRQRKKEEERGKRGVDAQDLKRMVFLWSELAN
jgi:hypothetical protein